MLRIEWSCARRETGMFGRRRGSASHRAGWLPTVTGIAALAIAALLSGGGLGADEPPGPTKPPEKAAKAPKQAEQRIDFVKQVQPLLRKNCFSCHGPETKEGGFRLDNRGRALAGGDSGVSIVPGKSGESLLIRLVRGEDEDLGRMPPEGEGRPLTAEEQALLTAWIDQGADWPESADAPLGDGHWAFRPIERTPPPAVKRTDWVRSPLDRFVLARLEAAGVEPNAKAERAVLIRRLYLDLLGLPPTIEEVDAFLQDQHPAAYERLVDRLLASPHYGERWGRHWLDLARYADSDGYEKDRPRPYAWRYRDWVIQAFNRDLPFDQFSIHQLAGDMLADQATHQIASGFHRNTLHNTEGGTDQEEDRVKKTVDRTNTLGAVWLGMTVGCAQCHTHKYDPLTQREYFQLYAFLNNIEETNPNLPEPAETKKYELAKRAFDAAQQQLQTALESYETSQMPAAQQKWEASFQPANVWQPLAWESAESKQGAVLELQEDGSYLVTGKNEASDVYTLQASVEAAEATSGGTATDDKSPGEAGPITALRLEALPDKRLPKSGPGRAENGNFVIASFAVLAGEKFAPLGLTRAEADFSQKDWPVAAAISAEQVNGWAVSPQIGKRHVAIFELETPLAAGTPFRIVIDQKYQGNSHNLGRFRLSVSRSPLPATLEGTPAAVAAALALPAADRTAAQVKQVTEYFRGFDPQWKKLHDAVAAHAKQAPQAPSAPVQAVAERKEPRTTKIHIRGNFLEQGAAVEPRVPAVLARRTSELPTNRRELAQWLFRDDHPLTARVTVNRVWQRIFGRGIVATVDDFGTQGQPPSHPALLDWLASEFQAGQWSLKHLHRILVTSATYQQSARVTPESWARDPDNILLARHQRRRVEAELVRDLALAVSGLWDPRVGGPSVRPRQPTEYAALTYANSAKWQVSKGGDRYRRGLYTFFQRTSPYPMLITFDSPDSTLCTAQRAESNTPIQALTLWNDPVFFEAAQSLGRRIAAEGDRTEAGLRQRARFGLRACIARVPDDDEINAVQALYLSQLERTADDPKQRDQLIGSMVPPPGVSKEELAAWIVVGRALLNLDEFITSN